jgi:serine protease Do
MLRFQPARTLALAAALCALFACAPGGPLARRACVQRVLPSHVRLMVYDGDELARTASGVALGKERDGSGALVVTNAHAVDPAGLSHPRFAVLVDRKTGSSEYPAQLAATGAVPDMDLALLRVGGLDVPPAQLAPDGELEMGAEVLVAGAAFGRRISLSGGMISSIDFDERTGAPSSVKTDAPIGYGASGGGMYSVQTGRLLAIVEGYRTAQVDFEVAKQRYSFDVPMPGETFAAPAAKLREFLSRHGYGWLAGS